MPIDRHTSGDEFDRNDDARVETGAESGPGGDKPARRADRKVADKKATAGKDAGKKATPSRVKRRAAAATDTTSETVASQTGASQTGAGKTGASQTGASQTGASQTGAGKTGAGMAPEQAEVLAETYAGLLTDRLATNDEVRALEQGVTDLREEMHREIGLLREEMHREIGLLREETKKEFVTLRTEIGKDLAALRSEINARIAYSHLATIVILSAVMGAFRIFG